MLVPSEFCAVTVAVNVVVASLPLMTLKALSPEIFTLNDVIALRIVAFIVNVSEAVRLFAVAVAVCRADFDAARLLHGDLPAPARKRR